MFKAEELRVAMARRRMNIGEVAESAGVHRDTVSLIVNDRHENAQVETLERIAKAVGLQMQVVFTPVIEAETANAN